MTSEGATAVDATSLADDGRLFCYRHPERETYVRCGRCDRPICTRCAMQGPVGFRCKKCGTLANDPLTTFRPSQIVLGFGIAAGGGLILGAITGPFGFFAIIIAFFGGGIVSEAVMRVTGYKRGPVMLALVIGGILAGMVAGVAAGYVFYAAQFYAPVPVAEGETPTAGVLLYVLANLPWFALSAAAAVFGAYSRLR